MKNFREHTKAAADKRKDLQDILLNGLCFRDDYDKETELDKSSVHIVNDLCGFLLHARQSLIDKITNSCATCMATLRTERNLRPPEFYGGALVAIRERYGGLKYCTEEMASVFSAVESILQTHFKSASCYISNSFEKVSDSIYYLTNFFIFSSLNKFVSCKAGRQAKRKLGNICSATPNLVNPKRQKKTK